MAEQLYFARHTKLFMVDGEDSWEIPVLDGFSFSQATNASEVTLQEMESTGGISRRGRKMFNDSYAPAEWSFQTYVRPFVATPGVSNGWEDTAAIHHAIEEALWANFVAVNSWNQVDGVGIIQSLNAPADTLVNAPDGVWILTEADSTGTAAGTGAQIRVTIKNGSVEDAVLVSGGTGFSAAETFIFDAVVFEADSGNVTVTVGTVGTAGYWDKSIVGTTTSTTINFDNSNTSTLGTFDLWFDLGNCAGGSTTSLPMKLEGAVVNSISIDFEIDGIATITWNGFANIITEEDPSALTAALANVISEDIDATDNFIRNRLTTLSIEAGDDWTQGTGAAGVWTTYPGDNNDGIYNVVLTGGSINFENNITFLTPDTLCKVDQPIGHVTGNRNIGGSFTAYVNTDTGSTQDLWEDLITKDSVVTSVFDLAFSVGGTATPNVKIGLPTCHLEIPTHSIEDVISLEVTFHALPTNISAADEAYIEYTGAV